MINPEISEQDRERINRERQYHSHPRVRQRMQALWLKSKELSHKEICRLLDISSTTLTRYLKCYRDKGVEGLLSLNFNQPKSELDAYRPLLIAHFTKKPPASVKQAMSEIETLTGIKLSEQRIRIFLKSLGMSCRKIGMIPAKVDVAQQETFKKKELEPCLEEAQKGERVVFFVDAAHFVLAPFLGFLWSFTRLFVRAPSGRKRFNVLGALNAITHELVTVTNDTYINAQSVCELLTKIHALGLSAPVTLILDNARYQKCKIVWQMAEELNIELLYLPPYSPNLNLIERLWKFVKKKCLYSIYYDNFLAFKEAITLCLSQTHSTYKDELDTLLNLKFQTFEKSTIMTL